MDWERSNQIEESNEHIQHVVVNRPLNPHYYNENEEPIWPPNSGFQGPPVEITLQPGEIVDRYGYDTGRFVSPLGTPYTQRSLPIGTDRRPYHIYRVVAPIVVDSGVIAPWFEEDGLGIQYKFRCSIADLIASGKLEELSGGQ